MIFFVRAAVRALTKNADRLALLLGAILNFAAPSFTETAIANGETRTINLFHAHTQEQISATYLVNGRYDPAVLKQLNWFLRDWRRDEPAEMDPRLFDVVWEAYRSAGAENEVIRVVSAYRSPETNAMLRARSRKVAEFSQHMLGKAMDTTLPGMPMARVREIGMRMQRGGVGYYPTANTPFVHLDVGNVRAWPRMTYDQLARLFPDGKTVHLPSNGQPLARYEEAKAEIEARNNGAVVMALPKQTGFGGFLASLFGGGGGEDDSEEVAQVKDSRKQWAELAPRMSRAARRKALENSDDNGAPDPAAQRGRAQIAQAETNLPRGETVMQPGPEEARAAEDERTRARLDKIAERERAALAKREQSAAEETQKVALVSAPLPPAGRPASIDRAAAQDERAAAAEDAGDPRNARVKVADAEEQIEPAPFVAPLPPRRPRSLGREAVAKALQPKNEEKLAVIEPPAPPARPKTVAIAATAGVAPGPAPRPKNIGLAHRGEAAHALDVVVRDANSSGEDAGRPARDNAPLAFAPPSKKPSKSLDKSEQSPAVTPLDPGRQRVGAVTNVTPLRRAIDDSVTGGSLAAVRSASRAPQAPPSSLAKEPQEDAGSAKN